jgi:hypothetical protein
MPCMPQELVICRNTGSTASALPIRLQYELKNFTDICRAVTGAHTELHQLMIILLPAWRFIHIVTYALLRLTDLYFRLVWWVLQFSYLHCVYKYVKRSRSSFQTLYTERCQCFFNVRALECYVYNCKLTWTSMKYRNMNWFRLIHNMLHF